MKLILLDRLMAYMEAAGIKSIESRKDKSAYNIGDKVLIGSTKSFDGIESMKIEKYSEILSHRIMGNLPPLESLPSSCIIGYVEISSVSGDKNDNVWCAGTEGGTNLFLSSPRLFTVPINVERFSRNQTMYNDIDETCLPESVAIQNFLPYEADGIIEFPLEEKRYQKFLKIEKGSTVTFDFPVCESVVGVIIDKDNTADNNCPKVKFTNSKIISFFGRESLNYRCCVFDIINVEIMSSRNIDGKTKFYRSGYGKKRNDESEGMPFFMIRMYLKKTDGLRELLNG